MKLKAGDRVKVFNASWDGKEILEGVAKVVNIKTIHSCDNNLVQCEIKFPGDEMTVTRWVWTMDKVEDKK